MAQATNSLPQSTLDTFQPISASAVHVLAAYSRAKDFWANNTSMKQVRTLHAVIEEGLAGMFVPGGEALK